MNKKRALAWLWLFAVVVCVVVVFGEIGAVSVGLTIGTWGTLWAVLVLLGAD